MLRDYALGQTSIVLRVKLRRLDTSQGLTGLTSASSGLIVSTIADNEATATAYTQAGATIEAISTLGTFAAPTASKCRFKEVDATNHPGHTPFAPDRPDRARPPVRRVPRLFLDHAPSVGLSYPGT